MKKKLQLDAFIEYLRETLQLKTKVVDEASFQAFVKECQGYAKKHHLRCDQSQTYDSTQFYNVYSKSVALFDVFRTYENSNVEYGSFLISNLSDTQVTKQMIETKKVVSMDLDEYNQDPKDILNYLKNFPQANTRLTLHRIEIDFNTTPILHEIKHYFLPKAIEEQINMVFQSISDLNPFTIEIKVNKDGSVEAHIMREIGRDDHNEERLINSILVCSLLGGYDEIKAFNVTFTTKADQDE